MEHRAQSIGRFFPLNAACIIFRQMSIEQGIQENQSLPQRSVHERTLWTLWRKEENEAARQELLNLYLPYARTMAAKVYALRTHDDFPFEEYLQFAIVALIESLDRYDPDIGAQFKTYAYHRISGAILSGLENLSDKQQQINLKKRLKADRLSLAKEVAAPLPGNTDQLLMYLAEVGIGLALGAILDGTNLLAAEAEAWMPDQSYERIELKQFAHRLRHLLTQLTEREAQVIQWHYLQEMNFEEIARKIGISKARISQLHCQGLLRLKKLLADKNVCNVAW